MATLKELIEHVESIGGHHLQIDVSLRDDSYSKSGPTIKVFYTDKTGDRKMIPMARTTFEPDLQTVIDKLPRRPR